MPTDRRTHFHDISINYTIGILPAGMRWGSRVAKCHIADRRYWRRERGSGMTRIWILGLALLLLASTATAKPTIMCDVKLVTQHESLVTFSWEASIASDKHWDVCELIISFQDSEGHEIHAVRERLKIEAGNSSFSGIEICDAKIWKRMKKYVATLDCVF
jgi:hypothetical protein